MQHNCLKWAAEKIVIGYGLKEPYGLIGTAPIMHIFMFTVQFLSDFMPNVPTFPPLFSYFSHHCFSWVGKLKRLVEKGKKEKYFQAVSWAKWELDSSLDIAECFLTELKWPGGWIHLPVLSVVVSRSEWPGVEVTACQQLTCIRVSQVLFFFFFLQKIKTNNVWLGDKWLSWWFNW